MKRKIAKTNATGKSLLRGVEQMVAFLRGDEVPIRKSSRLQTVKKNIRITKKAKAQK